MIPDSTMIAALLGVFGTIVAGFLGWMKAKADHTSPMALASAELAEAEAADLLIRNLSEQYKDALRRLTYVEARLEILDRRFAMAQGIVAGLPEEHRVKFEPVFAPIKVVE